MRHTPPEHEKVKLVLKNLTRQHKAETSFDDVTLLNFEDLNDFFAPNI
jgi:hypothetical protein